MGQTPASVNVSALLAVVVLGHQVGGCPDGPEVAEGVGLAELVAELLCGPIAHLFRRRPR